MIIALACDHGGFPLKNIIKECVTESGHVLLDLGTDSTQPVDYPDFAKKLGLAITRGEAERGILICGSGVGASIAANKIKGIYAGLCHDTYSAHQGVEHDNMNVLCLGARVIGDELAKELVAAFLMAQFSYGKRHVRRVNKVYELEKGRILE
ncbi:MAG: ribose 5-phosphate isomerase B [Anaerolineales bacterium]|nr:ribose 5-phosphate isomerase B [Anaerolineae bacterium]PWB53864.1 MAG: ribose 5-phosphate isomerase B [Anaerolineales bacterium]